jgi:hypothetical protein
MFERYTERSRRVVFFARYEAAQTGSPYIETGHLLLGILREGAPLFHQLGIKAVEPIAEECRKAFGSPGYKVSTSVDLPLSNANKRVLAYAAEEAERLGSKWIGIHHVTMGLLREADSTSEILMRHGVTLEKLRNLPVDEGVARITPAVVSAPVPIEFFYDDELVGRATITSGMPWPRIGETVVIDEEGKSYSHEVVDVVHSYAAPEQPPNEQLRLVRIIVKLKRSKANAR